MAGSPATTLGLRGQLTHAREELSTFYERLRTAQRVARMGFWDWNVVTNDLYWSEEIYRIFGLDTDDFGATYDAFLTSVHPDDRAFLQERVDAALAGDTPYSIDHRILLPTGEIRHVHEEGEVTRADDGSPTRMFGVVIDITERKIAEEAVRKSEARFRGLWEASSDALLIIDRRGQITLCNSAAERLFGYAGDELTGMPIEELVPGCLGATRQDRAGYLSDPTPVNQDEDARPQAVRRDGNIFPVETTLNPLTTEEGRFILVVLRDITHRRELEQRLLQSQKLEAVGKLAGGLAHDLNNVLTAIAGFSEMARASVGPHQEAADDLEQVLQSCDRATALVDKLLAFTRQQVRETRILNLNELIQGMSKMLERVTSEKIDFQLLRAADLPSIEADAGQLEQVLLNLVINASDAMPEGGRLFLETGVREICSADDGCGRPRLHAMMAVSDTGCGMDKETQRRAFEPFFTTKEAGKGTGLGLATVQHLIRENQGHLELTSEKGRGTTVRVFFPVTTKSPGHAQRSPGPVDVRGGSETVLLVEDDLGVRALTERILREAGYSVLAAPAPQHALDLCAPDVGLDLLITDVIMPGMNGTDLAETLKAGRPNLRVLYISGYLGQMRESLLDSTDPVHFLPKPFSQRELLAKVRAVLAAR